MVLHGVSVSFSVFMAVIANFSLHIIKDDEIKHLWLKKMNMSHYEKNFVDAGYDMETISRMTPQVIIIIKKYEMCKVCFLLQFCRT